MTRSILICLTMLVAAGAALADDPVIANVTATQRVDGSGILDIVYDAADAEGDTLYISIQASDDDGVTWRLPVITLGGDAGAGVAPGDSLVATWNLAYDHPGLELTDLHVRVIASDLGVGHEAHSPGRYVVFHWGSGAFSDPQFQEKIARADLLCVSSSIWWGNSRDRQAPWADAVRAINPDIKIIGYATSKTVYLDWEQSVPDSYLRLLWDGLQPFWSYTTTGDTLMDFPGEVVVNILEKECRDVIVNSFVEFQQTSVNAFDGVFWDYFNNEIWIPPWMPNVEGLADLDGNGIPMTNDLDERLAYMAACDSIILGVRAALGDDFIQIFNGQRAYRDSTFAAMGDGMMYELFPEVFFPGEEEMRTALDPDYEYNLFRTVSWPRTVNGGPYNIIENKQINYYFTPEGAKIMPTGNFLRAVALLTDTWSAWNQTNDHTYGWTNNPLSLGQPLGPTVIDGDLYTRQFEYGDIELTMGSGMMPTPFSYTIRVDGRVVEHLDFPAIIP